MSAALKVRTTVVAGQTVAMYSRDGSTWTMQPPADPREKKNPVHPDYGNPLCVVCRRNEATVFQSRAKAVAGRGGMCEDCAY
jgi:hypothetical protein